VELRREIFAAFPTGVLSPTRGFRIQEGIGPEDLSLTYGEMQIEGDCTLERAEAVSGGVLKVLLPSQVEPEDFL